MTREEAIEIANEVQLCQCIWIDDPGCEVIDSLVRFAQRVQDKTRPEQEPAGMLHIDRLDKWLDASLKKRKPLTDEQKYALIKEHLGLDQRREGTVIDRSTGQYTDAARYFDLIDAAIEAAHAIKE